MEQVLQAAATAFALGLEAVAILVIAIGSLAAAIAAVRGISAHSAESWRRQLWLDFAGWIVLALEFALAADIVRTAVAPSWDDIGKLAAIATVRTALNYFLWRDLDKFQTSTAAATTVKSSQGREPQ